MENNINDDNKNRNETSVDYELICTICSKPSNDLQSFPCGHTFCRQCITKKIENNHVSCPTCQQAVTINNFPEINHAVCRNVKDLLMKHDKDKQTALRSPNIHNPINEASFAIDEHNLSSDITLDQNEQQNKYSAARLFEPFKDLLIDLINQNKQFRDEINQIKKQNQPQFTEQPKKNEELQLELDQLKEQNHLQFTEQSKKNEKFQLRLNQLKEQNILVTWIATISGIFLLFYYFSVAYSDQVATINQSQLQLNEQSRKIEYLRLELDQLREQSQLQLNDQSKKNEGLQLVMSHLREHSQLELNEQSGKVQYLELALDQLKEQSQLHLTDQSKKNEDLQVAVSQLREQNQLHLTDQSKKNEDLQLAVSQLREQSQLQLNEQSGKVQYLELELDRLNEQSQLQLTDQSKKNEDVQLVVNQLREQSQLQLNEQSGKVQYLELELDQLKEQSRLQLADQSETNQRQNLLEINVKSIRNYMKYLPREYILMFQRRKIIKKEHGNKNVPKK